jgi:hypothetical protein
MLRLELMVVFAWRFARTTVAAYVVNMARRIPHVLSCQMTKVEPSERRNRVVLSDSGQNVLCHERELPR